MEARSSGGEHYLDTVGVGGSNPPVPSRFEGRNSLQGVPPVFWLAGGLAYTTVEKGSQGKRQNSGAPSAGHWA